MDEKIEANSVAWSQERGMFVIEYDPEKVRQSMPMLKAVVIRLANELAGAGLTDEAFDRLLARYNAHEAQWYANLRLLDRAPVIEEAQRRAASLTWPPPGVASEAPASESVAQQAPPTDHG